MYSILYSGGQKQAQRVSKLIALCTKKAKEFLCEYKSHCNSPDQTTIEDVFNMSSPFWTSDHTYALRAIDRIPVAEQRRLIELTDMRHRCLEELQYCISDILNMYAFFTNMLIQLNLKMCAELSASYQDVPLDPSDSQLYLDVGKIITSSSMPKKIIEIMSATIVQAEYTFYRLQRINDVATNLVMAYWAEADSDRQKYIRKALFCSNEPICVPCIDTLIIHAEIFIENVTEYEENHFDSDNNSTNDENDSISSESYCTDLETDHDSHLSDIESS